MSLTSIALAKISNQKEFKANVKNSSYVAYSVCGYSK